MAEPQLTDEQLEELQQMQKDQMEDQQEDQQDNQQDFAEEYGAPEPEERMNQHSFLNKATFESNDTVRTTFLNEWELGRPMFNVRFLLDMEDISKFYLDEIAKDLETSNRVSDYFKQKIHNITDSGMSKEGFAMNLNVTKKIDSVRKKVSGNIENLKGGNKIGRK